MMTYTYSWFDAEKTSLTRVDEEGNVATVPAVRGNMDYEAFLASGETAADYVAPPEPEPLTTEEKVNLMLANYGLTRDEMRTALQAKTSGKKAS